MIKIYRVHTEANDIVYASSADGVHFTKIVGEFPAFSQSGEVVDVKCLLAPVEPPAIYIIGYNYAEDPAAARKELGEDPVVVMKAVSTVVGPEDAIELPPVDVTSEVDYEGELAVVIGKSAKNVPAAQAFDYIFGYTIANDLTARDLQRNGAGGQWVRGKNLDSFCPLGPSILKVESDADLTEFRIRTEVNGELRQDDSTRSMIFSIPEIIEKLTAGNTLLPGTVILTGTPSGTGVKMDPKQFLKAGDSVRIEIDGIGVLENKVQ